MFYVIDLVQHETQDLTEPVYELQLIHLMQQLTLLEQNVHHKAQSVQKPLIKNPEFYL